MSNRVQHFEKLTSLIGALPSEGVFDRFGEQPDLPQHNVPNTGRDATAEIINYFSNMMVVSWDTVRAIDRNNETRTDGFSAAHSVQVCLKDKIRTRRFAEAVMGSVRQKSQGLEHGSTIEVCDAGTGAFGLLAICAALASERVHVTALETTGTSAAVARNIINNFGLERQIDVIETDAKSHKLTSKPDIIVSETMDQALLYEPIVKIMANLVPQAKSDALILPDEINLHAALTTKRDTAESFHSSAHKWPMVYTYHAGEGTHFIDFQAKRRRLERTRRSRTAKLEQPNPGSAYYPNGWALGVYAEVRVGPHWLKLNESALTIPAVFEYDGKAPKTARVLYAPGARGLIKPKMYAQQS